MSSIISHDTLLFSSASLLSFSSSSFFANPAVLSAILNIVRLVWKAAVPNLPNDVATRIYLSGLFIFLVTLQGIYQEKLASLLTKPMTLPNAERFEDLENFNYTIYGNEKTTLYFKRWNYSGRVVSVDDSTCVQCVSKDDSAACVGERRYLVYIANKYDLHLSATIVHTFLPYMIRQN